MAAFRRVASYSTRIVCASRSKLMRDSVDIAHICESQGLSLRRLRSVEKEDLHLSHIGMIATGSKNKDQVTSPDFSQASVVSKSDLRHSDTLQTGRFPRFTYHYEC